MSQSNSKYTPDIVQNRSPRYVLQMKDKKIMRYATFPRSQRTFNTEVLNLSETGMAFTVPFLDAPQIHETIMVEFTPPDEKSFACYAKVLRVQKITVLESDFFQKDCKVVAVKFEKLSKEQSSLLRNSLQREFKKIHSHFYRQQLWLKLQWHWKFKKIWILSSAIALSLGLAAMIYILK